ncbi:MAG: four-helix bundle copper-binding protein [Gemmatimonadota bacterium]
MSSLKRMLDTHPHPAGSNGDVARDCIEACSACAQACTVCADACLSEEQHVLRLVTCIRLNLDCADVCRVTAQLLTRPSHRDAPALQALLEACIQICKACADECGGHASMQHCKICADVCRKCVDACEAMAAALVP